ncbi:MAG: hypothetical protein GY749_23175 [Desulfobacteraceae bacterium]|nr:hypothetical protein [Desulfobacteraceae bacterium]
MTNEVSLKFLLDQLKVLISELKDTNQKYKNTNEQSESIEDQKSDDELECLQEQFELADQYAPEEYSSHALDDLAFPLESVRGQIDNNNSTSFLPEVSPVPVVTMSPQDLVLACSNSIPSVESPAHSCAIGYNQCLRMDTLTLLRGFAQHAAPCSSEKNSGYKVWKPGLRSA